MAKKIQNLLFDLGGVIVDIDRERCVEALVDLGMPREDVEAMLGLYVQAGTFLALEAGEISADEFCDDIATKMPRGVTRKQIRDAVSAFIIGIPRRRLKAIRRLRKRYRTYVLSNTNPIMFEGVIANNFGKEGMCLRNYFDGVTVSYQAHANKPSADIFNYAIGTMRIRPEETLFIDDSQTNLDAAKALGFETLLIKPGEEFADVLTEMDMMP